MRKKLIIAGILLILAVAGVWGGSVIYANVQNSRASGEFTLSPVTGGAGAPATIDPGTLSGIWKISTGSQAGYRVDEVLNGQNATVVGRTSEVSGEVTIDGTTLTAATAVVDMGNVSTDSRSRDQQFLGILKTAEFPTSTFTLTEPVDIAGVAGGAVTVEAVGELTVAGITKTVTATLSAQATDDGVEVQGAIPIAFLDFGVQAPNLGFVKVEDTGSIEMLLKLAR